MQQYDPTVYLPEEIKKAIEAASQNNFQIPNYAGNVFGGDPQGLYEDAKKSTTQNDQKVKQSQAVAQSASKKALAESQARARNHGRTLTFPQYFQL